VSYYDDASLVLIPSGVKAAKVYSQKPTNGNGDLTFSRASTATRTNASGLIESVASNVPRLDYSGGATCPRLLLEGQRTNSIRNSSMVGAVAGTPGTLPTNWAFNNDAGLTRTIVGIGVENGLPYFDVRFNGTATSTFSIEFRAEQPTQIAALTGQAWSHSVYMRSISSVAPPSSIQIGMYERTSGGSAISSGASTISLTSSLQRFTFNRTLSGGATVAFVQPYVAFSVNNATAYDFTIRIAAPQMELGAYATTWIPTTTATVTRLADNASKTGISSLIGQTEGTIYFEGTFSDTQSSQAFMELTGLAPAINFQLAAGLFYFFSASQWSIFAAVSPNVRYKIAAAYKNNDIVLYINGVQRGTDTTASVTAKSNFYMNMRNLGDLHTDMRADQVLLFPTRLTNAQMQELTTL